MSVVPDFYTEDDLLLVIERNEKKFFSLNAYIPWAAECEKAALYRKISFYEEMLRILYNEYEEVMGAGHFRMT